MSALYIRCRYYTTVLGRVKERWLVRVAAFDQLQKKTIRAVPFNHSFQRNAHSSPDAVLYIKKPAGHLASRLTFSYWQDGLDLSPTARIERAHSYRARSASTGEEPGRSAIPLKM
jgi:hypothetical protein